MGSGSRKVRRPADPLCMTQAQAPKGWISGPPTTSHGKLFQLWALGLFCTERHLAKRLKNNSFYPFTQQQPNGAHGGRRGWQPEPGGAGEPNLASSMQGRGLGLNGAGLGRGRGQLVSGAVGPGRNCRQDADCAWSPGTATPGCEQGLAILMRARRAAPSLRARVLPGHAVEGDAALRRLPLPCQLRYREPGLSS